MGTTSVTLEPGSTLAGILGEASDVPCHHHQAVDRLAGGLVVSGRAADGTIEAMEVTDRRFALGVQWHPEDNPSDDRLFAAFARTAASTRVGRP